MSFLDRLSFWRKKDEYNFDTGLPPDLGAASPDTAYSTPSAGGLPEIGQSFDKPSNFEKQNYGTPLGFERNTSAPAPSPNREIEIISLKLDAIKAELDAVNQRLIRVEKLAELNVKGGKATSRDIWATY
ncbi:MAG TPA: hypothetical protein VJG90_06630 [Candidatus Nanoarchaeia archaeon]|nr:hypothetical protein [Candidatus Nanoarchaeia archaeon]